MSRRQGMRICLLAAAALAVIAGVPAGARAASGDAANGGKLFPTRCGSCHSMDPARKMPGPSLKGVAGREAAGVAGFKYSKAMTGSGWAWDDEHLDKYLAAPSLALPGTAMTVGVAAAKDRADLIAWLKSQ